MKDYQLANTRRYITYKKDKSPVLQVLVLVYNVSCKGGRQEAHNVCEPVRDTEQRARKVGRHVDVCTHKS